MHSGSEGRFAADGPIIEHTSPEFEPLLSTQNERDMNVGFLRAIRPGRDAFQTRIRPCDPWQEIPANRECSPIDPRLRSMLTILGPGLATS
jgi:hypothetical protein